MSGVRGSGRTVVAWAGTVLALSLAAGVVALVRSEVVHGPLAFGSWVAVLLVVSVCILALATTAALLVLARAPAAWHTDGYACCAVLIAVSGALASGWERAPDPLRSVGVVLAPLVVPALLVMVERRALGTLWCSVAAASVVGGLSLVRFAVRDPLRDPGCWADCSLQSGALVASDSAARVAGVLLDAATAVTALAAIVLAVACALRPRPGGVRATALDLGVAAGAAIAASAWAVAAYPPSREVVADVAAIALAAQSAAAALVAVQCITAERRRRKLRKLAVELGDRPLLGALEETLRRVLGDSELTVAYWLPESQRYVDSAGADPVSGSRTTVTLHRDGQPLARIHLGRADRDSRELEELLGPSARLAIDSERLQAEIRAQLVELVSARRRIVAAADTARQQVERTIHDEVQSELLGALFELASAESSHDERTVQVAASVAGEVRELLADMREFARGVYPAVLDGPGLPAALAALADEAPVAIRVVHHGGGGAMAEADRTAYLLVHDAVVAAREDLDIEVDADARRVLLTIVGHAGAVRRDLADRVGALGGTIRHDGSTLRVVLPCA